jgi:hypothetical protein
VLAFFEDILEEFGDTQKIEVYFWSYIGEEKRFGWQALLVEQICCDQKVAKSRMGHLFQ